MEKDTMIAYHLNFTSNSLLVADVELMTRFLTKDVLCKESINAGVHVTIVVWLAVISVNAMGVRILMAKDHSFKLVLSDKEIHIQV